MLEVIISGHGMPCVEIRNPTVEVRDVVRSAVLCNRADDVRYQLAHRAGAFLQGDDEDWILVEFWGGDYQPFVDHLNQLIGSG